MIKKMLERREECDAYLTHICRHCCSLHLQLMKATVLAESSIHFIFSQSSFCPSNVYRHESGRCCTLPFFLTFFICSFKILYALRQSADKCHSFLSFLTIFLFYFTFPGFFLYYNAVKKIKLE